MAAETQNFNTPTNTNANPAARNPRKSTGFAQINLNNSTPPVYQAQSFGQQIQAKISNLFKR